MIYSCVVGGTGILAIAQAVSEAGWIGLFFLCLSACMSHFTGIVLIQCLYYNGHNSRRLKDYSDIGHVAFGRTGQIIGWLISQLFLILTPTIYITMASENIAEVLFEHGLVYLDKNMIVWLLLLVIGPPFVLVRNMKDVSLFSTFASICTVCLLLVVIAASLSTSNVQVAYAEMPHVVAIPRKIPIAFSTFTFSFCGHVIYPHLEESMETPERWPKVLLIATLVVGIMYLLIGTVGYFIFGPYVQTPIYKSLTNGHLRYLAMMVITLHVIFAIPFYLYVFTIKIESWLGIQFAQLKLKQYTRYMVRVVELVFCGAVSMLIPQFSTLMAVVGTVLADTLSFVLPTVFWIKLNWHLQPSYSTMGLCIILGFIGIVCAVIGSIDAVDSFMKDYHA
ncbi:transmembrane amino acid transporter protein-domain-containing protein [Mycotypha africana]|uniref:transmembrane amino acid transporter protein-domain-containing protein n=1 Tax=Mycotypha africana TaxID=64632 RepID=UPI002300A884|nr:transmembrane amino acid transporter protein-domain-containing protein [Mycotypha africana]KAI8990880.1 transmembrane amino acid transporter protein-domain-containing protein [Mycotypha africana]